TAEREQAIVSFKRLILLYSFPEVSPLPELANIQLAELAIEMDKSDDAKKQFEEMVQAYPDSVYGTYATASLAMMENRKTVATSLYKKIREAEPIDSRLLTRIDNQIKVLGGVQ
ncbi:MAG TPA: hypothetical protein DER01_18235, partial [Phycisphaerales bacterium]|nr:hypothetical protein [Phycisphaerales bacterium]